MVAVIKLKRNVIVSNSNVYSRAIVLVKGRIRSVESIPQNVIHPDDLIMLKTALARIPNPLDGFEIELQTDYKTFRQSERKLAKFVTDVEVPIKLINEYVERVKMVIG